MFLILNFGFLKRNLTSELGHTLNGVRMNLVAFQGQPLQVYPWFGSYCLDQLGLVADGTCSYLSYSV